MTTKTRHNMCLSVRTVKIALKGLSGHPFSGRSRAIHRNGRHSHHVFCSSLQTCEIQEQLLCGITNQHINQVCLMFLSLDMAYVPSSMYMSFVFNAVQHIDLHASWFPQHRPEWWFGKVYTYKFASRWTGRNNYNMQSHWFQKKKNRFTRLEPVLLFIGEGLPAVFK